MGLQNIKRIGMTVGEFLGAIIVLAFLGFMGASVVKVMGLLWSVPWVFPW
jgi:hypothetical protein